MARPLTTPETPRLRPTLGQALTAYVERRALVVLCLGFASGLPYLLVFSTLSAWLRESGLSVAAIGWFALAGSAYVLKFVWAPVVNQLRLPILTSWLGQRRSWLFLSQVMVALAIVFLGTSDPAADLARTAFWAVVLASASATQDIVADAYRIDSLDRDLEGPGTANFVNGYRLGVLASGAGALLIADHFGWPAAYGCMALLMSVGLVTTLVSPEPKRPPPRSDQPIRAAVIEPFQDFTNRRHWVVILLFITLFQYGEGLLGVMANPFYLDIGFTKTEIALVTKAWGFAMSITGAIVGGLLVARFGLLRTLFTAGIAQCLANLAFAWLAAQGVAWAPGTADVGALTIVIAAENLTSAMATAAFVAYLSALCDRAYSATQYALLTAFAALGRKIFVAGGGEVAQVVGWESYFILTAVAALPALCLLAWLMRRDRHFR